MEVNEFNAYKKEFGFSGTDLNVNVGNGCTQHTN